MKKIISIAFIVLLSITMVFAEDQWWQGQEIEKFEYSGLHNVSSTTIDDALYPFRHSVFSDSLYSEIENVLYAIDGIDIVNGEVEKDEETGGLKLVFTFYEIPMLSSVSFEGNENIKTSDLRENVTLITAGTFYDTSRKSVFESAKQEVIDYYTSKGYQSVTADYTINEDSENNTFSVVFSVSEEIGRASCRERV